MAYGFGEHSLWPIDSFAWDWGEAAHCGGKIVMEQDGSCYGHRTKVRARARVPEFPLRVPCTASPFLPVSLWSTCERHLQLMTVPPQWQAFDTHNAWAIGGQSQSRGHRWQCKTVTHLELSIIWTTCCGTRVLGSPSLNKVNQHWSHAQNNKWWRN